MDYQAEIRDIEDLLFPQLSLSGWERILYYHLIRHTRLIGEECAVFGMEKLAQKLDMSVDRIRKSIRSLHHKKCIVIDERSRQGHSVRVSLPSELGLSPIAEDQSIIDIELIDYFAGRNHVETLVTREGGKYFYCLRAITKENCVLDHVRPQLDGNDNSYRNVVVACHDCNSRKGSDTADNFLRLLYREGLLNQSEFSQQLTRLEALQDGRLVPDIANT